MERRVFMEEKKYLKWYNKVGYGSGDIAGNVVYALLAAFVMIYLTDIIGLNAGIVGTLIAISKIFDGISDVFFGAMIDKTKTKMGKARPWMLYGYCSDILYTCGYGKYRSVCMVFYSIYIIKCRILYSQQYCILITYRTYYKE